jgi:membrane protease YdiL (CAAX protease family)
VILYALRTKIGFLVLPLILALASGCVLLLFPDKDFPKSNFWRTENFSLHLRRICLTFIVPAAAASVWVYCFFSDQFLVFPSDKPYAWLVFLIYYPLLAAYPQEIIFRGFFFQRYGSLFQNPSVLILVSGICFGWAHLLYGNWIAPVISTFGGILFGYRYLKSRSLLVVGLEHGLWGSFLFLVGLGWYFSSGCIGQ